ncbi:S8 family serine peptidase [Haliea sp. E1-2-M8]|uniref:S8 family serine peptidase n=1 Tax=Haliea sp. E1-2-M8 TaxID=3064706 RepID=UPI002727B4C9|nr:S8 family serine peptidase [Haliea sp. E1-2-M8]MDO8861726.1 S8 family serine peptidase [Haliea sp. E1-2-M8]
MNTKKLTLMAMMLPLALAQMASSASSDKPPKQSNASGMPAHLAGLRLAEPVVQAENRKIHPSLMHADGPVEVIIRLSEPSVAESGVPRFARAEHKQRVTQQQNDFRSTLAAAGAQELGAVDTVLNAMFARVDPAALAQLANNPAVVAIRPVGNYEVHLDETVDYIGAAAVQTGGTTGSGVKVAVLDSGIDYTHVALGGSGDPAEYEANDPDVVETGTFPTARVVGGYDFVGSQWPGGPLADDADPLDDGPASGHGTHVADIIGGSGGVAPDVDLYAVKVCSSVSSSCSGIALIEGLDWAVEAEVDIINMSLGSPYGQAFDDDLSTAVDGATAMGVLTVASAGNSSNKPYILGSPSAAPSALSVAQTQVPSASLQQITAPGGIAIPAVFQPWSPELKDPVTGLMQYGATDGSNLNGCAPFAEDLSEYVVLVDRGACAFTLKAANVSAAGGKAAIIGLVAPGEPFEGGSSGDTVTVPSFMISQADSNTLKGINGTEVSIDPANSIPLVGQMVGSSSRGPSVQFNALAKPEIGAPGGSVSAIAGSGTDTGPFGGTSGAAPMVSGAAALLLSDNLELSPAETRALLVNTGETDIRTNAFSGLAPIARIGGGEVRADKAAATPVAAWDVDTESPVLSFGFVDAAADTTFSKTVTVRNYSDQDRTYTITPQFRYDEDDTGAVVITTDPSSVTVGAENDASFTVTATVAPAKLKTWYGNSGALGADPAWITDLEYDGYIQLQGTDEGDAIHLPWHILPRKASDVSVAAGRGNKIELTNTGAGTARVEAYHLIATSPQLADDPLTGGRGQNSPITDFRAIGYRTEQVPANVCGATASYVISFAITSWEPQTHANVPNLWDLYLDYDGDGIPDANIYNFEAAGNLSDGRNLTFAAGPGSPYSAFFFTDHETNSRNTVLNVCAEQIGLKAGATHDAIRVAVGEAYDLYFQGEVTDSFASFSVGKPGNDNSPLTFQGNNSGYQAIPAGATVSATRGANRPTLLLIRGGSAGAEAIILD